MADAEIIQLGSRGQAGRGSGKPASAAARGLSAATTRTTRRRTRVQPSPAPVAEQARAEQAEPVADAPLGDHPSEPAASAASAASAAPPAAPRSAEDPIGPESAAAEGGVGDQVLGDEGDAGYAAESAAGSGDESTDQPGAFDPPAADARPSSAGLGGIASEVAGMVSLALAQLRSLPVDQLRDLGRDPLKALLQLAESLGVDWQGSVEELAALIRSRMTGAYAVDEFGFDPEFTTKVFLPLIRPLARSWFRVEVRGTENLPVTGSALLVSNHAGTLPLDGMIVQSVVYDEIGRHVRMLGADLIFKTPYSHDFARRTGTTLACQEDAERLLASNHLVAVFPEGFKGLGKPYADRYKLQRFGRGGFVSAAIRGQVPLIPISIVGSEEIFPMLANSPTIARALGFPYFPLTPTFPWLGVLGLIPLPSKWIIQFGEAITTDELSPGAADDPMVVFNVTDQVRETIQHSLYALLMQRNSFF